MKNDKQLFLFSKRAKLAEKFEEYAKENNVLVCPLSVITWLYAYDMLNVDEARKVINGEQK